jgi:hypothetical protein
MLGVTLIAVILVAPNGIMGLLSSSGRRKGKSVAELTPAMERR